MLTIAGNEAESYKAAKTFFFGVQNLLNLIKRDVDFTAVSARWLLKGELSFGWSFPPVSHLALSLCFTPLSHSRDRGLRSSFLLQSTGAALVSFLYLPYRYESWHRDNPFFQESQLKIRAHFPSSFSALGTKANHSLCNPPDAHRGPAR